MPILINKIFSFTVSLFLVFLVSCSKDSKKSDKTDINSGAKLETNSKAEKQSVFINEVRIPSSKFYAEVIYLIDKQASLYKEWVKVENDGILKYTKFEFKFDSKDYSNYLDSPESYESSLSNFGSDYRQNITDQNIQSLTNRFKNLISESEYETIKSDYLNDSNKYNVESQNFKDCDQEWIELKANIINSYKSDFQSCSASKYHEYALDEARSYIHQNAYLSYPELFGIGRVNPRFTTFFEIAKGSKKINIGTAISKTYPFFYNDEIDFLKRNRNRYCGGNFITKNAPDFSKYANLFLGASSNPFAKDFNYFLEECYEVKRKKIDMKSEVNKLFPNTSAYFKTTVSEGLSRYGFFIDEIDQEISKHLDQEIEKLDFFLNDEEQKDPKKVYQNWKFLKFKDKVPYYTISEIKTYPAFEFLTSLKSYILDQRTNIIGYDNITDLSQDIYFEEDKKAIEKILNDFKEVEL